MISYLKSVPEKKSSEIRISLNKSLNAITLVADENCEM